VLDLRITKSCAALLTDVRSVMRSVNYTDAAVVDSRCDMDLEARDRTVDDLSCPVNGGGSIER
jgi:hypothetical protein